MYLLYCAPLLILGTLFQQIAPECQYPSQLRGEWVSSDRGEWNFVNETLVQGIETDVPNIGTLDFICLDNVGSTYLLQAVQFINIFGKITRFFACWSITNISEDIFKYYSETEYDTFLSDYLFSRLDDIATLEQACNKRPKPIAPQTFNIIARKSRLESGMAARECPLDLQDVFNNVTFTRNGFLFENISMDGNRDHRKLIFASPPSFTSNSSLVLEVLGEYSCVYDVESEGMTFLSVWHNKSRSFSCMAFRKEGDVMYAHWTQMFCSANLTEDNSNYYRRDTSSEIDVMFAGSENAAIRFSGMIVAFILFGKYMTI